MSPSHCVSRACVYSRTHFGVIRALYVYTAGIHELMHEVKVPHIVSALWRAFVILLEDFHHHEFVTALGQGKKQAS